MANANTRHIEAITESIEKARDTVIANMANSREYSLVMTKLDEALMWAKKGLDR